MLNDHTCFNQSLQRNLFTLTPEQFAQLKSGDQITLGYGSGERQARRVGRLKKGRLEQ